MKNITIESIYKDPLELFTNLVLSGYGAEHQNDTKATYIKPDILSVVNHILYGI